MWRIGDTLVDFMRWLDPAWRKNLREIEEWRAYEKGFVDAREGFGHAGRGGGMFVSDEWEEYARKRHETEGTEARDFLTRTYP